MNKLRQWFYDKKKNRVLKEMEEYGIKVIDEEKFHRRIIAISKSDMIYSAIFFALIIYVIINWLVKL